MGSLATASRFSHADNMALEDMHDQIRRVVVHAEHVLSNAGGDVSLCRPNPRCSR